MPYVGFHPDIDPGHERAVNGGRKLRKWVVEVIPEQSMRVRYNNWRAERAAHGSYLRIDDPDGLWDDVEPPNRIVRYGATTGKPLVVFYRTPWPVAPQPWPDTASQPRI